MYQTIANLRNIEMDGLAADWQTLAHVFASRLNMSATAWQLYFLALCSTKPGS